MTKALATAIEEILPKVTALRHHLHAHPETGFNEHETQARLRQELASLGLNPKDCARTGLVVDIGPQSGQAIALRADIDALPMTEGNPALPYRSKHEGRAHMCGHDGHSASLVGAARLLAPVADKLPRPVRLLFQPAEEYPGGAPLMIEEGVLNNVETVYGMHNWPSAALGELRTIVGPCMATVTSLKITVQGKGGHASQPQSTIDPVLTAAHIIVAAQSIISRNVHSRDHAVLSMTMVHGGEVHNVIPDTVEIEGTIRALSGPVMTHICERLVSIAENTAKSFGARARVELDPHYPVLINDAEAVAHVEDVAKAVLGADKVSSGELPMLASEDFAYYAEQRPACFFFLGGGEEGRSNSSCHSTDYDFNDKILPKAMTLWLRLVESRMGVELYQ